jgi:hypothetical protein
VSHVVVLVATIPARKRSCERLLAELKQKQTRKPDELILVLDGYADAPAPTYPPPPTGGVAFPVHAVRTYKPEGAGNRWRVVENATTGRGSDGRRTIDPESIVVCIDDDILTLEAPRLIEALVAAIEADPPGDRAAAAMGRTFDGKPAPPGTVSRGMLIYAAGAGLAVRARYLEGIGAFADEVHEKGGPDAFGPLGDDDALVSAYLWKRQIPIAHAATGNIFPAPNTQAHSQTRQHIARRVALDEQKKAIRKATGWPWPVQ